MEAYQAAALAPASSPCGPYTDRRCRTSAGRPTRHEIRCRRRLSRTHRATRTRRPTPAGSRTRRRAARRRGRCAAGRDGSTTGRRARTSGVVGTANSRIASRPPGLSTRRISRARRCRSARRCGCRTRSSRRRPTRRRPECASRRRAPARSRRSRPRARSFSRPTRSIAPAKSTPTTRARRRPRRRAAIARSAVPVHRSSTRSRPVSASDRIARLPPAAIDAGAQQVVEEIVARGDRVEHARDALRRFRDVDHSL